MHLEGTTELTEVEKFYKKALEIEPNSVDVMLNFSTLYRQHRTYIHYTIPSILVRIVLVSFSSTLWLINVLRIEKYEEALNLLKNCEAINPHNALVLNNHGLVLHAIGDVQQACIYFDRAQVADPNFEPAKANREKLSYKPSSIIS
jgi:tetratricopeptide (TPR) repeat protein